MTLLMLQVQPRTVFCILVTVHWAWITVRNTFLLHVKNVHKKVLNPVNSRRFGNNPFISRMFQPLGQNQTFTVHAGQMMLILFETCARDATTKTTLGVRAACLWFSLQTCSTYHPVLKYTFEISKSSIPFLNLCVSISNNRVSTNIHYVTKNYCVTWNIRVYANLV